MPQITHLSQLDLNKTYSYADYLTWQLRETVELIKGKIMLMLPTPNGLHQRISGNLHGICHQFFGHKKCRLFAALFDVRLYDRKKSILANLANQDVHTVVQPGLCVIHQFVLDDEGHYQPKHMYADGIATPALFPDLAIDLAKVFEGWTDE